MKLKRRLLISGFIAAVMGLSPATAQTQRPNSTPAGWKHFPAETRAPAGAPNVLLIMTDDVGFGTPSTFGGPVPTPAFDELAAHGLRYNQFHTTAMCSPSRAALLTGRNHHSVNSATVAYVATDDRGYTSVIPDSAATVADILRSNGYATAWIGKNHNTPTWEQSSAGPFNRWPTGLGFDYFYGFNMSMANQFAPALTENLNAVDVPPDPDYFMERDFADHAIAWMRRQETIAPDKPFFLYYAPGAAHTPLQAPDDWIARFKGRFDQGWDKIREETFRRQKAEGIIPKDAVLTPRPKEIPAWDSLTSDEKRVAARLMEVHAALLAYSDDQIGRVLADLKVRGELDNTLVIFVQGDNGASAEFMEGTQNEVAAFAGLPTGYKDMAGHLDDLGGPNSWVGYPSGWGWAMNAPFPWAKQIASHLGGVRNGLVISWPKRIQEHGEVRTQFHHLVDIMPTILDAAGVTAPDTFEGVAQQAIEGTSMTYTFDHENAPSTRRSQYFEMLGNRAWYKDGWMASTTPERLPWLPSNLPNSADQYKWELYNLKSDYSQSKDLSEKYPEKLAELRGEFDAYAAAHDILPLRDDYKGRTSPTLRPNHLAGRTSFTYYPGDERYTGASFPPLMKSWTATASLRIGSEIANEALVVRGDHFGGWGLFLIEGKPTFILRATEADGDFVTLAPRSPLTEGMHTVEVRVRPPATGGVTLTLTVDGTSVAETTASRMGFMFGDAYVGRAGGAPLVNGLPMRRVAKTTLQKLVLHLDTPTPAAVK